MNVHNFANLLLILSLFGCGNSPLFNHSNADDLNLQVRDATDKNCPLFFPNSELCASLTWNMGPNQEESAFTLKFWKVTEDSNSLVDPAFSVWTQLWMPAMGHGSSPVMITRLATGIYAVTKVYFIMPGSWDIRIQLKNGKNVVEQAIWKETIR